MIAPAPSPSPPPPAPHAPELTVAGELRRGDDVCEQLCDTHRFTWAVDGPVRVAFRARGAGERVHVIVIGPDGNALPPIDPLHNTIHGVYAVTIDAKAGHEYALRVEAASHSWKGVYAMSLNPGPASQRLAEERPIPPPPTPEEEEPDHALGQRIATIAAGTTAVGTPKRLDLTRPSHVLRWKAARGRCYLAVIVLEAGARLETTDDAEFRMRVTDSYAAHGGSGRFHSQSRRILVGGGKLFCAATAGSVNLEWGLRGTGTAIVTLYEQQVDAKELVSRAIENEQDLCTDCMKKRLACQRTGGTGEFKTCHQQFAACIRGLKVKCQP